MKLQYLILVFILSSVVGFSQGSNQPTNAQRNLILRTGSFPDQYLWNPSEGNSGKSKKSLIDFDAIDNWRGLGNYLAVSGDGNFFAYTINKPTGTRYWFRRQDSLVVQSTHSGWRLAFAGSQPGFFTANGKKYIFQDGESLCFLQLGKSDSRSVKDVKSYKVSQQGNIEWLAWQLKGKGSNLILHNLITGKERKFSDVIDYNFHKSGEWLVCKRADDLLLYNLLTDTEKRYANVLEYTMAGNGKTVLVNVLEDTDNGCAQTLKFLSAPDWGEKTIWSTHKLETSTNNSIDDSGRQVVFSVQNNTGTSIWYFNTGMDKAIQKVTNASPGIAEGLVLTGNVSFTDNGKNIKFFLQPMPDTPKPYELTAQVEVWDHKDLYLKSAEAALLGRTENYTVFFNIESGKIMPVESNGKKLYLLQGDFAVVKKYPRADYGDRFWEAGKDVDGADSWIVSLKDGSWQVLPTRAGNGNIWFSPGGKYLVYFDMDKGYHFFSYNLQTGNLKDISSNIPVNQLGLVNRYKGNKIEYGNLAAWVDNETSVLVYDNYDIWRLDLTGKAPAINITNGFGQSNNTMFVLPATHHYSNEIPVIKENRPLVLRAFNIINKQSGFYRKSDLRAGDPKLLYLGNYFMDQIMGCHDPNLSNDGMTPLKARDRKIWIVQRQSSTDAPNYYETNDFKRFKRLTDFQPQQHFRWVSEELHTFKHLDGREGQGILYKPDDFDSSKKYPVIIVFYGAFSNNLNQFHVPTYIDQSMEPGKSPVWLVNNGYLVFTPDIYTTPLKYGPSAFNVIEGAAQYLKQFSYVDAGKIGCASHSWSAKLGAYIFTHSSTFSATAISEGFVFADPINMALSVRDGKGRLEDVEIGQEFGNLWENKDGWLEQTTVLHVDKASSPLLLFSNKESSPDYQDQTLQLFSALRRLEKNVWWLKYDNGAHTLQDLKELKDYTVRYTQFFNHYLKEAPAPLWMTHGLPLTAKGIESRYELDPKGSCGKDCVICKKWNEQYKKHPHMFDRPIQEWHLE